MNHLQSRVIAYYSLTKTIIIMVELKFYEDKLAYVYRKRPRSIQPYLVVYKLKLWI